MKEIIILIFMFSSAIFADYNDTTINYIFKNRHVFEEYFKNKDFRLINFLFENKNYERENIWQKESLFTGNANIESYYKNKNGIISSISGNRKLMIEPAYFKVILPLIKEERLELSVLKNIPMDILIKNKKDLANLLSYIIIRDSQRWDKKQYYDKYDFSYKGYAQYAVLARLDSIYNYKMIPLWDSYVKDVLSSCIENYDDFQKKRFITASEFLKIVDTCSNENKKLKEKAIYYIENTTDSGIIHYVNKSYFKEDVVKNFLGNPPIKVDYIRYLGDASIISEFAPYIISIKKGRDTDFAYFLLIENLLRSFYYDFDLKEKYFNPTEGYKDLNIFYDPKNHNNRPLSDLYSENYMDFMKKYKVWLKKKFGKELKREPQPNDIVVMGNGVM